MRTVNGIALATLLTCALAAPAMAGGKATLTAGGRTLTGPGTVSILANAVATVYTDAAGNRDVCATVVNGNGAPVRLTLTGGGSVTFDVPSKSSSSLCRQSVTAVTLTCLGPSNDCSTEWRIDNQ